jgi:hypothetical protein
MLAFLFRRLGQGLLVVAVMATVRDGVTLIRRRS